MKKYKQNASQKKLLAFLLLFSLVLSLSACYTPEFVNEPLNGVDIWSSNILEYCTETSIYARGEDVSIALLLKPHHTFDRYVVLPSESTLTVTVSTAEITIDQYQNYPEYFVHFHSAMEAKTVYEIKNVSEDACNELVIYGNERYGIAYPFEIPTEWFSFPQGCITFRASLDSQYINKATEEAEWREWSDSFYTSLSLYYHKDKDRILLFEDVYQLKEYVLSLGRIFPIYRNHKYHIDEDAPVIY